MNIRKNATLNTWGVFFYFFSQWILTIAVTRINGYAVAGQYSLVVSFTNIFSFIGMFGIRGILVSDVKYRYSNWQYAETYLVTCIIAGVAFMVVLYLKNYDFMVVRCCVVMMLFKIAECINDCIIGIFQRASQFAWIAIQYTFAGILPASIFVLILLKNIALPYAISAMAIALVLILMLYGLPKVFQLSKETGKIDLQVVPIMRESFPLMMMSILDAVIVYLPRDAVERSLGTEALGYYSTVSVIVVVLSTIGSAVWGSILPHMSQIIGKKDWKNVHKINRMVWLGMLGICILVIGLGNLMGPSLFEIIFGKKILSYMYLLTPILLNALFLLFNSYFQCFFIPIGKRFILLNTDLAAVLICALSSNILVETHGILGACIGLTISLAIRATLLLIAYIYFLHKIEKRG